MGGGRWTRGGRWMMGGHGQGGPAVWSSSRWAEPSLGAYLGLDQGRGCETPGRQSAKIPKSQNWRLLRRE